MSKNFYPPLMGSIIKLTILLSLFQASFAFFIDSRQSPSTQHWSYADQESWQVTSRQCGKSAQSPIDIQRKNVIQSNALKLQLFNYEQPIRFKIQNSHHTIKMVPLEGEEEEEEKDHKLNADIRHLAESSSSDLTLSTGRTKNHPDTPAHHSEQSDPPASGHPDEDELEPEFEPALIAASAPSASISSRTNRKPLFGRAKQTPNRLSSTAIYSSGQHEKGVSGGENETGKLYNGAPTLKLDWLDDGNNEFKLRDIHFHWAERRDNGSEHAIDGRRAAMEMHLVHMKHGLDKSKIGFTSDSIAVIAVLIESYRKSNADFNPIVSALGRINSSSSTQEIKYESILDILPNSLNSFYTYSGSLTTPPCYQVVNWVIMSERLYLNAKQIEMFRNLYAPEELDTSESSSGHQNSASNHNYPRTGRLQYSNINNNDEQQQHQKLIMPNIRQLQPLNNRTILASFAPLSRLEQIQEAYTPQSSQVGSSGHLFASAPSHLEVALLALLVSLLLSKLGCHSKDKPSFRP